MSSNVNFYIKAGLPFKKTIVVDLPSERDWWLAEVDFEVRFQLREQKSDASALIANMMDYCTTQFDAPNTFTIYLEMTGAQTREITKSGYYDLILSDSDLTDARAYEVIRGSITLSGLVSSAEEPAP